MRNSLARLLLVSTLGMVSVLGCVQSPESAKFVATVQTQVQHRGTLQVFHQSMLYDQRGNDVNAIMRHHTFVLINRTEAPVQLDIRYQLTAAQAQRVDLESYFGIMLDILPAGVGLPAIDSMAQLAAPTQEKAPNGVVLHWTPTTVAVDAAAVLYFGAYEQDGGAFRQAQHVTTDLASMDASSSKDDSSLKLTYRLANTSKTELQGIKMSVFVPDTKMSADGAVSTPIFEAQSWSFEPEPDDYVPDTSMADGTMQMAQGTLIQFGSSQLAPGAQQVYEATASIKATGEGGTMVPYVNLVYYASEGTSQDPSLSIRSGIKLEQVYLPALFVCNLGWPDWIRIPF